MLDTQAQRRAASGRVDRNHRREQIRLRVRRARAEADIACEALAMSLDMPKRAIAKFERGERGLDIVELMDVARALGKPISYFLEDEPCSPSTT